MKIQAGQIVQNKLSNGSVVTCRVIGFVDSVGMWRLTDARETSSDAWLIAHNRTWAAPESNIIELSSGVRHKSGLVTLTGVQ